MDTMFNKEQSNTVPDNNIINSTMSSSNRGLLSAEALKSMMNKRKLAYNDIINEEQMYQKNGNDSTKRLYTTNSHQHEQKT
jgi:arginine utilization protein RocB